MLTIGHRTPISQAVRTTTLCHTSNTLTRIRATRTGANCWTHPERAHPQAVYLFNKVRGGSGSHGMLKRKWS
eukprot:1161133-Pelagomonas_calceolata.AAC.24